MTRACGTRLALAITCVIAVAMSPPPASGETAPVGQQPIPTTPRPTGEIVGGTPSVVVALDGAGRTMATRTYRTGGAGPRWTCVYLEVIVVPGSTPELGTDVGKGSITPEVGQLVALTCSVDSRLVHQEIFTFDPAAPFGTINAAADAALLAREMLPLPDPDVVTSPPAGRPQLVGVATWFRVDTAWQPVSATATLGAVSATVTATPTQVVFDPGDGSAPITCTGPGPAFDAAQPDATSDCAHTYQRRTPDGTTLDLTATITYDVAWTATDGTGDTLDPVTRTSTVALTINEAQALVR